jgi:plasmid replication initiation protein
VCSSDLDASGTPLGIELILPDWFYAGVLDAALVLTIDPAYFRLSGGIERWLYRLVRKHGGKQPGGWQFDFKHLHRKSGSLAKPYDFARDLRVLVERQSMPGYELGITLTLEKQEILTFRPVPHTARG